MMLFVISQLQPLCMNLPLVFRVGHRCFVSFWILHEIKPVIIKGRVLSRLLRLACSNILVKFPV